MHAVSQYYVFMHQSISEEWTRGVQRERAALKRVGAAFFAAVEGEERLDKDTGVSE